MGVLSAQVAKWTASNPLAAKLVAEVEQLPGLSGWSVPEPAGLSLPMLLQWGHVIETTKSIVGAEKIVNRVASEILNDGAPRPETFAELSGASVCVSLGAIAAGRIQESKSRSADWRMIWPPNVEVDIEVTAAKTKDFHLARRKAASILVNELYDPSRSFDVVIHIVDPLQSIDVEDIRRVVREIREGEVHESSGRWEVRADRIVRDPTTLFTAGQDHGPTWWPADHAKSFVFKGFLAGPNAVMAPPQTRICVGLPFHRYFNVVQRKADQPQGTSGLPFLIALDVDELPGALKSIPTAVEGFLPLWTRVSGILLFHQFPTFDHVGWRCRLIRNPHAVFPLPSSIGGGADIDDLFEVRRAISEIDPSSV